MKTSTIKLFVNDSFKSLRRNKTLSLASVLTVALTMIILGCFLLVSATVDKAVESMQSKLDIQVYLKDDITQKQQDSIESKIKKVVGNDGKIEYISKEAAFEAMKKQQGKESLEGLENVLPASFKVNVKNESEIASLKDALKKSKGLDEIKEGDGIVETFDSFRKGISYVLVGLTVILFGVSLFLIQNTIKLTVFSRRREISIMKHIGATDWFIRWPFLFEGIIIGIIGALTSVLTIYVGYSIIYDKLVIDVFTGTMVSKAYIITAIMPIFLLFGIVLGATGSAIAIRKFLKV